MGEPTEGTRQERILVLLLRLAGGMTLLAFLAMVMPASMMAEVHAGLGLGAFPAAPVTEYMARSLSALYGFHGGLLMVLSTDVRQFAKVVTYVAVLNVLLGAMLLWIDLAAGLPMWWTLAEGPPIVALGAVMLWLLRAVR